MKIKTMAATVLLTTLAWGANAQEKKQKQQPQTNTVEQAPTMAAPVVEEKEVPMASPAAQPTSQPLQAQPQPTTSGDVPVNTMPKQKKSKPMKRNINAQKAGGGTE